MVGRIQRIQLHQPEVHHKRTNTAAVAISEAKRALGIGVSLAGALGRKTKFQENATSLLLLRVTRLACAPARSEEEIAADAAAEASAAKAEAGVAGVPGHVIEEDDTLLTLSAEVHEVLYGYIKCLYRYVTCPVVQ